MDQYYQEWNRVRNMGDNRPFNVWLRDHAREAGLNDPAVTQYLAQNPVQGETALNQYTNEALIGGAIRANQGGNTNQVQGSQQTGQFNTTGTTQQTGTQTGGMTQNQTQTGTQTGAQTQTSATNQVTDNTATTNVNDRFGLADLVAGQAGSIAASDAARQSFLTDVVSTGGEGFQDQVQLAANQALSGPGMQGVGNMAKGRVAGAAIGDVARNNMAQRLQASNQLAGPTGMQTAAGAVTPYLGSTTTSRGTASGTSIADLVSSATSNQSGQTTGTNFNLTDLVSKEAQSGSSNASGVQVATGQIPEGKQQSGGGCYACTAYNALGLIDRAAIIEGASYKLSNLHRYGYSLLGYSLYGPRLAKLILRNRTFARMFYPVCRAVLYEERRRATGVRLPRRTGATVAHAIFHYGSHWLGRTAVAFGYRKGDTLDPEVRKLLHQQGLWFNVNLEY